MLLQFLLDYKFAPSEIPTSLNTRPSPASFRSRWRQRRQPQSPSLFLSPGFSFFLGFWILQINKNKTWRFYLFGSSLSGFWDSFLESQFLTYFVFISEWGNRTNLWKREKPSFKIVRKKSMNLPLLQKRWVIDFFFIFYF